MKHKLITTLLLTSLTGLAQEDKTPRATTPVIDAFAAPSDFTDNDKDGFDDLWHRAYASVAEEPLELDGDPDKDGKTNREEMELFQDPLTWTNYSLKENGDVKLAPLRRQQLIASLAVAPIQTAGGATTMTGEAQEIQSGAEAYSAVLGEWQEARRGQAAQRSKASGIKIETYRTSDATLDPSDAIDLSNPVGLDEDGRPFFHGASDSQFNVHTQIDQLQPGGWLGLSLDGAPLGLPQTDRSVDVWDLGVARGTHTDLQGSGGTRIVNLDGSGIHDHATRMAGIIGGLGLFNNGSGTLSTGAATQAKIAMSNSQLDLSEMSGRPLGAARASNHSYAQFQGWNVADIGGGNLILAWLGDIGISTVEDFNFGRYTAISGALDQVANSKPWTLQVRTASNERDPFESFEGWTSAGAPLGSFDGQTGLYFTYRNGVEGFYNGSRFYPIPLSPGNFVSVTGTPQADGAVGWDTLPTDTVAKNMLTIGAVDENNTLSGFSGVGPTDDGRLKPEIVAPGVGAFSASSGSDSATQVTTGTSTATAVTSGGLALLHQHQENLWGPKYPLAASTAKSLVVHTAQELGTDGPNYDTGFGLLQTAEAATLIESNYYAENTDGNGNLLKLHTFLKEVVLPESEWVRIDLGSDVATTSAEINWNAAYASGYVIEGSTSAQPDTYVTLATGYGAVGGIETKTWSSTNVRYVRLVALTRATPNGISVNELTIRNGGTNLSSGRPASASSDIGSANNAAKVVDGNVNTRWASIYAGVTEYPWVQVDLGAATSFNNVVVTWDTNYASEFLIEGASNVSGPYTQIGNTHASTGGTTSVSFASQNYRYVRLVAQRLSSPSGVSIREFQIFNGATLLSAGDPAIANSRSGSGFDASLVTDGNLTGTRWQSAAPGLVGSQFPLKAAGGPIRVTAAWSDPAAAPSPAVLDDAQSKLVNDIDLRVFRNATSGVRLETKPWTLNPALPANAAVRGDNFRDNIEQVETASAVANSGYTLELKPKMNRRIVGRQRVSLTISGVTQIPLPLFQGFAPTMIFDSPNNQVIVTGSWSSVAGQIYSVEWSHDLVNWNQFPGHVVGLSDITAATWTISPLPPRLFLRYSTEPPNPFNVP